MFRIGFAATLASTIAMCLPALSASPSAGEIGRYVIIHSPIVERDTMLLDTVTGRTWQLMQESDLNDEPLAWSPVPQLNSKEDMDLLIREYGLKPSATPPASQ